LVTTNALAQRPLGTDVSGYQPSINWTTVQNAGVTFAWAKATEGTGYTNPDFVSQENGARGVGIYIGAYHFARPSSHPNITGVNSADSEAAYFWSVASNYVHNGGSYLVPMLDWEDPLVTNQLSAVTMSAWVNEWCNSVSNSARLNGVILKPVVYTGTWYSRPSTTYSGLTTSVTNWPSWIAAYPTNPNPQSGGPSDTFPWPSWNLWQYADTNWSGGDSDVFNGNSSSFIQTFVIGGTNAPNVTSNPASLTVAAGSNATFTVHASGTAPLSFRWLFNGTVVPGAVSSNYTIANAQLTNAGGYVAIVSNSYAAVSTTPAFLSVLSPLANASGSILAPPGMVNWWPAEGNARDIFGPNNATPNYGFSYAPGEQGLAFHFDGASSYLTTGAARMLPALAPPSQATGPAN
jgi:GH25 family lysozyme M1 (1,4-beta-N-acetylmuramidase)